MRDNAGVNLSDLVLFLNKLLSNNVIEDYKQAINGLQVENTKKIEKISIAVDACEAVIKQAVANNSDLLIVHHGLFWNGSAPVSGPYFRKLKMALENNLAIYSSHLPLDAHPQVGNNALLANRIGLSDLRDPFLGIGWQGTLELTRSELLRRTEMAVDGRVHCCPGGPDVVRRVGIVSGGAGGEIFKAAEAGVDTFITGEGPHWSYTAAEELGVNLFYAGHYATETFGVKALGRLLEEKFGVPGEFIDHPTGL